MQHCFADNMVDRKLYVIVIVIATSKPGIYNSEDSRLYKRRNLNKWSDAGTRL